jgi:hypothetical protein
MCPYVAAFVARLALIAAALFLACFAAALTTFAVSGERDPPVRATRTPDAFCTLTMLKLSQAADIAHAKAGHMKNPAAASPSSSSIAKRNSRGARAMLRGHSSSGVAEVRVKDPTKLLSGASTTSGMPRMKRQRVV